MKTDFVQDVETFPPDLAVAASNPLLRVRARVEARALDRRLAGGADPFGDPCLALRAQRLTAWRTRRRFAREIERVLETLSVRSLRPLRPVDAEAVQAARPELLALAARLEDEVGVSPRGMAMVSLLFTDGRQPLFDPGAVVPLAYSVRMAFLCLDI